MSLITRNAKEYRSMTAQLMSQNLPIVSGPFGIFCVLRHPNHFVLAGTNNRNVIITYRFLAAPVQANSIFFLHLTAAKIVRNFAKKLRYFRFPPNVAHRKLTDLANYVPRFRPRGVMSFTQRFFKIWENDPYGWFATREYVASFAKNEYLYRQISTKYKSSKLFWRILEDNKQNKHENRGKKTVWILRADRRFV